MRLEQFCDRTDFDKLPKGKQAVVLAWFHCKSTSASHFTIEQISDLFASLGLARPNLSRLRNDFKSDGVIRGEAAGTFQLSRPKAKELCDKYGSLLDKAPLPLTPTERADLSKTPKLSSSDIDSARRMAELYVIIHCFENSARQVIGDVLSTALGSNWWDIAASAQMKNTVQQRKDKEAKNRWISPRGPSPLFYVDWGDLLSLIRRYETHFRNIFPDYDFVVARLGELERLRNIIAHNGVLPGDDEFDHVVLAFRQWCKQLA